MVHELAGKPAPRSSIKCQQEMSEAKREQERRTRMSILNAAGMGNFSPDRSIEICDPEIKIKEHTDDTSRS
jgi:glucan phosphorylase